ncbi:MAG: hypothetical protein V1851_00740 [Patescibacteria group bacterium]
MLVVPSKKEIVGLVEAQASSIEDVSNRLVKLERSIEKQDSKNNNIIIGVLVALVFIVATVAVEVILTNIKEFDFYSNLSEQNDVFIKEFNEQRFEIQRLDNNINNIKIRNPYLK